MVELVLVQWYSSFFESVFFCQNTHNIKNFQQYQSKKNCDYFTNWKQFLIWLRYLNNSTFIAVTLRFLVIT